MCTCYDSASFIANKRLMVLCANAHDQIVNKSTDMDEKLERIDININWFKARRYAVTVCTSDSQSMLRLIRDFLKMKRDRDFGTCLYSLSMIPSLGSSTVLKINSFK